MPVQSGVICIEGGNIGRYSKPGGRLAPGSVVGTNAPQAVCHSKDEIGRSVLAVTRRTQRPLKALSLPALALLLALVLVAVLNTAMPTPAFAVGAVVPLDGWPATPQLTATTGNMAGTFAVSDGINRLLVVLVCGYDSAGNTGQTFTATYGGKTLTQAFLQNNNRRQTWIGYLKESDIASRD